MGNAYFDGQGYGFSRQPDADLEAQNRARSAEEVRLFREGAGRKPGSYFAYWLERDGQRFVSTWMGDALATITWTGQPYRIGTFYGGYSQRRNFRAQGIDGQEYAGTCFMSSGTYVRIRPVRGSKH